MKILVSALIGLAILTAAPAFACDGQTGRVIYDDNFADDSGGWDLTPPAATIVPPNLLINLGNKTQLSATEVLTFHAKDADYCVEGIIPKPAAGNNSYYLGLLFWASDYNNYWLAEVSDAGMLSLWQRVNGGWQSIIKAFTAPGAKPDGSTSLRVQVLNSKISIYYNGQLAKAIRAQEPDGDMRFGVYAQSDAAIDGPATPIKVSRYTVTASQ